LEEFVRNLHQHSGTVTGFEIAADGSPMLQIAQNFDTLFNDVMGFLTVDSDNESDAAGVVFKSGIVKTAGLGHRQSPSAGYQHSADAGIPVFYGN
jgi:hypothetical protein